MHLASLNRLSQVKKHETNKEQTISFLYNAQAQRIGKTVTVIDSSGAQPVTTTAKVSHIWNGDNIVLDGWEENGTITSESLYLFGAGFEALESGYNPVIGHFTQMDSYLGEVNNPQTLNLYVYANSNPVKYMDPTGHAAVLKAAPVCPSGVLNAIKLTKWNKSYYVSIFSSTWKSRGYQIYSFQSNVSNSSYTRYNFWVKSNTRKDWYNYIKENFSYIETLDSWFENHFGYLGETGEFFTRTAFFSSVISEALRLLPTYAPKEMRYILNMLKKSNVNDKTIYIVFYMDHISVSAKRKYVLWGPIVGWRETYISRQVKPY